MQIKELKTEFDGTGEMLGYHFKQIKQSQFAYIYELTGYNSTSYEVFSRIEIPEGDFTISGKVIHAERKLSIQKVKISEFGLSQPKILKPL